MYVCAVYVSVSTQRPTLDVFFYHSSLFIGFKSHWTWGLVVQFNWLDSKLQKSVFSPPFLQPWENTSASHHGVIRHGCRGLNSGPHPWVVSPLTNLPIPLNIIYASFGDKTTVTDGKWWSSQASLHRRMVWNLEVGSLVYKGKSHVCLIPGGRMREESSQEYTEKSNLNNQEK